uniref:Zinc finger protein 629 n=1 Tax=Oncorhynchus kisutch TaxID=8019 RepID=A0A8C7FPD6_ONCKI
AGSGHLEDEAAAVGAEMEGQRGGEEEGISQMVTSTDTTIMSLSRLQRLSAHAGAWTSEPQPQLPAPWTREPLPPAPWAREPPPLPPEPTPWTREKQHVLPGSGIPTQATEWVKPYRKKAFTCAQCGKGFVYMCHLRVHMQCHTGERPFSCSQCGKSFVYLCNLKSHQQYHTGEKPHSCSQCGKSFSLQSGLKKHRVIHSTERPYHCTNCGNRFYSRADLKRHEQIHAAS